MLKRLLEIFVRLKTMSRRRALESGVNMAKQYKGDIWIEEGVGTVNIGFTNEFIREILSECFHITQASMVMLTKDRPMLTVETNEGLKVIRSPVTGPVIQFDHTARDFPDKLTEDSVVLRVKPASVVVSKAKEKV